MSTPGDDGKDFATLSREYAARRPAPTRRDMATLSEAGPALCQCGEPRASHTKYFGCGAVREARARVAFGEQPWWRRLVLTARGRAPRGWSSTADMITELRVTARRDEHQT